MRRIAFYSYDERGLGHVRRSIAIAHAFSAAHPSSILLIAGAREAALFTLPAGTDTLALPAPGTDFNGARRGPATGLDRAGTVRVRARALRNALAAYRPDVLVVDRVPLGADHELRESLAVLQAMGTRLVLGLRDILDAPDRTSTLCELLAARPRALVVPRAEPAEQRIRARRLAARGAFDMLEPEALTASAVTAWLAAGARPRRAPATPAPPVDTGGLRRLPALLDDLLAPGRSAGERCFQRAGERADAARTGGVPA